MRNIFLSSVFLLFTSITSGDSKKPEAIGHYYDGQLLNGQNAHLFFKENKNFITLLSPAGTQYSTIELLKMLQETSLWVKENWNGINRLQIGDISKKNGGKLLAHIAHQNGLDVDIAFLPYGKSLNSPGNAISKNHPDRRFKEVFVENQKLLPNFDIEKNFKLLTHILEKYSVLQILLDCQVKKAMLKYADGTQNLVSIDMKNKLKTNLIAYPHHTDHFHLRLSCPEGQIKCSSHARNWKDIQCPPS